MTDISKIGINVSAEELKSQTSSNGVKETEALVRVLRGSYNYAENSVTDKEQAKKLLIMSSKNWSALGEELKKDPEIALYYQPMGLIVTGCSYFVPCGGDFGPGEEVDGKTCDQITNIFHEPEFVVVKIEDLKMAGRLPIDYEQKEEFCLIPRIFVFGAPRDFNLQAYLKVARELFESGHLLNEKSAEPFCSQFTAMDGRSVPIERISWKRICVCNRLLLPGIVKGVMQSYEQGSRLNLVRPEV